MTENLETLDLGSSTASIIPAAAFLERSPSPSQLTDITFARYTRDYEVVPTLHNIVGASVTTTHYALISHPCAAGYFEQQAATLEARVDPSPQSAALLANITTLKQHTETLGFARLESGIGTPTTITTLLTGDVLETLVPNNEPWLYLGQLTIHPLLTKTEKLRVHQQLHELYEQHAREIGALKHTYMVCSPKEVVPFVESSGFRLVKIEGTELNIASNELFNAFPRYWRAQEKPELYRVVFHAEAEAQKWKETTHPVPEAHIRELGFTDEHIHTPTQHQTMYHENVPKELKIIQRKLKKLSPEERDRIDAGFTSQLKEYEQLHSNESFVPPPGTYVLRRDGKIAKILPEPYFSEVLFSREAAFFTDYERERLAHGRILFLGLSTGSPVLAALTQLGIGRDGAIMGLDPDTNSLSNLSRLPKADIYALEEPKAVSILRGALGIDPYAQIMTVSSIATPEQLEALMKDVDIVVEMVDHLPTKVVVNDIGYRLRAMGYPVHVVSGAGKEFAPSFTVDCLPQPLLEMLTLGPPDPDPLSRIRWIILASGHVPDRQLTNFLLAALGEVPSFISQTGPTASDVGNKLALMIADLLLGRPIRAEIEDDMQQVFRTPVATAMAEAEFLSDLQKRFPEYYPQNCTSLRDANIALAKRVLGLEWTNGHFTWVKNTSTID